MKPKYRLQIEFDFNAKKSDLDEIENWMKDWFQMELDTWNEHSPIIKHSGALNVNIYKEDD